ncbi:hypothetical protein VZ95_11780, partial [Elstera litoralis]
KFRDVEGAVGTGFVFNSDFLNACTNRHHRLPIVRLNTVLNEIKLIPNLPSDIRGRTQEILLARLHEDDRFYRSYAKNISYFV